ncbi:MAG: hypothetical protein WBQ49_10145, partial [Rhodomicrobium sp.]
MSAYAGNQATKLSLRYRQGQNQTTWTHSPSPTIEQKENAPARREAKPMLVLKIVGALALLG